MFKYTYFFYLTAFLILQSCSTSSKLASAERAVLERDFNKAGNTYQAILKKEPSNVQAIIGLGNVYYQFNNYSNVIATLEPLTYYEVHPSLCNAFFQLGDSYLATGQDQKALDQLEAVINKCPQSDAGRRSHIRAAEASFRLGITQYNSRNYQLAIPYFKKSIRYAEVYNDGSFTRMDEVYFALADAYFMTDQNDAAISYFKQTIEKFPNSASAGKSREKIQIAYNNGAVTAYKNAKFSQAALYLEELIRLDSPLMKKAAAQVLYAKTLNQQRKYQRALDYLSPLNSSANKEIREEIAIAHFGLGEAAFAARDYQGALAHYDAYNDELLPLEERGDALFHQAQIYAEQNHTNQAIAKYERYVGFFPLHSKFKTYTLRAIEYAKYQGFANQHLDFLEIYDFKYPSDSNKFLLASLHGERCNTAKALTYLHQLSASNNYTDYIRRARNDIRSFSCLANVVGFRRWLSGIRRYKLEINEAYSADADQYSENDLFVSIFDGSEVMLCTEVVNDRDRASFIKNEVVFECGPNSYFVLNLIDDDGPTGRERFINESLPVTLGSHRVKGTSRSYVDYTISVTNEAIGTDNRVLPADNSWVMTGIVVAALLDLGSEGESFRYLSCLTQSFVSRQIENPVAASAVAMAIDNVERREGVTLGAFSKSVALNMITSELNKNGHSELALLVEAGSFLDCVFN